MIAKQGDDGGGERERDEPVEHTSRGRTAINVVADKDGHGLHGWETVDILGNGIRRPLQQVKPAVNIPHRVDHLTVGNAGKVFWLCGWGLSPGEPPGKDHAVL
ncbi:hypothetical protein MAE02_34640 [Microvirga aerophila]|uniref:Uncharacterized protein n=1 Tax=Microvirga aerophila TaxID=670291 RepID=A0A512BUX0_9HYPH|nr:hypothetical protein MAE02_34640 [Microvirga aerophila]